MNRSTGLLVAVILTIATLPAEGQWLNVPTKSIPRTKGGKPDLAAAAPRKPNGKPDLSGVWQGDKNGKYLGNLAADFKPGELPIQPWAEVVSKERMTGAHASEIPDANCIPAGVPQSYTFLHPFKIIQQPDLMVILYEAYSVFRQIFLDGRELPKDPNPTWLGYSIGRWEGDALVVETTGFNGKKWLDNTAGHPSTDVLHFTERFRRRDFGHVDLQLTIDDPNAYTRPWSVNLPLLLLADTDLMEYVCNENEKDLKHMVGK